MSGQDAPRGERTSHLHDRRADSLIGGALMVGGVLMAAGAFLPALVRSLDGAWSDDPQQVAAAIVRSPTAWGWANGLILAASIFTAIALTPFAQRFEGSSRGWSLTALAVFAFAAVVEAIDRMINIQVFTWAAQQHLEVTDPTLQAFLRLGDGLGFAFYVLGFLALLLFGLAILTGADFRAAGWGLIIGGAFGLLLAFIGAAIPAMVFFGTWALGLGIWKGRSAANSPLGSDPPTALKGAGNGKV